MQGKFEPAIVSLCSKKKKKKLKKQAYRLVFQQFTLFLNQSLNEHGAENYRGIFRAPRRGAFSVSSLLKMARKALDPWLVGAVVASVSLGVGAYLWKVFL